MVLLSKTHWTQLITSLSLIMISVGLSESPIRQTLKSWIWYLLIGATLFIFAGPIATKLNGGE